MTQSVLGIVGGSGLYDIPALSNKRWEAISSPWGAPSDQILFAEIDGLPIRFMPRHGRGHKVPPSAIDYRANIDALKRAGVTDLVSISACGSLKEEFAPGHFVLVDQFIDRTFAREKSFFGPGCVAHVSMADPVSPGLVDLVEAAAREESIPATRGGTYLVMEGPQFSTRAESNLYRSWGCAVIGMTNMPEAKLAREAELCYATLALATDYDVWHETHAAVSVEAVVANLLKNVATAKVVLKRVIPRVGKPCDAGCGDALASAVITNPAAFPPRTRQRLALLLDRYFPPKAKARRRG